MEPVTIDFLLEEIFVEGRFEDAQKKYPEIFDLIAQLKQGGVNPKYIGWFAKKYEEIGTYEKKDFPGLIK